MTETGGPVGYGPEATERLRAAVTAAKGGDVLAPVTVIVPSNQVGVTARRLLGAGPDGAVGPGEGDAPGGPQGIAAVSFLTPYRLAELLGSGALAGTGRRPVSTAVVAAAVRRVLADASGRLAPVADHPATEEALVAAYRELRELPEGTLGAVAATSATAAEVVRIHRLTRALLGPDWYDEEGLMAAAGDVIRGGGGASLLTPTIVYLPQRLSSPAAELLAAVAERVETTVLFGVTGAGRADAEVVASVGRLGVAPVSADHTVVSPVGQARTRIVATSDADEEVRAAVRAVVDAARAGVPLGRMAVLSAAPVPYARLVHDHLQGAGIDRNGASPIPLRERLAARILLHLLDWAAGGFRRWDLFAGLSDAPLRAGGRRLPFTGWDRLSREAAVVAGRADWDLLLTVLADAQEAEATVFEADPERPAWLGQRARRDAADARRLREFAIGLIDDLAGAASTPRPWSAHAEWARGLIGRVLGPTPSRAEWPAVEQKAAERLEAALVRLGALDDVEGAIALEVFTRTLRLVLDADLGRIGRLGEGVLVGSVGSGVGLDLDLVVVVGLAEGAYPTRSGEDPLLDDRARAATSGLLRTRRDSIDRQHRQLLAALAGARCQVLTVPRGDLRRSTERVPSRWVLDIASELAGHRWWARDLFTADEAWVDNVPSFEAGLRATAFPATEQEHHLTRMMAAGGAPNGGQDATLARGVEVLTSRRSTRFTRFDGNLAAVTVRSPTGQPTSATRLEQWAVCPWSHLLANHLGVQPVEEPDDRLEISPLDRGNLIHEMFETFFGEVLRRPLEDQPGPDDPWTRADHARLQAIGEDVCAAYETRGLTGKRILWQRDRAIIVNDLDRALTHDDERRRQHRARPVAGELAFGTRDAELGPVEVGLPDGRAVAFRGRIDRIDRLDDGGLLVIDYKTGRSDSQPKLTESTPVDSGRKLQLPVYAAAARARWGGPDVAVRSEYWFATSRGRFKTFGYQVTPEVMGATAHTLGLIVSGIEAGTFPNHPTASSTNIRIECPYCDPDGLGVVELRRQWEGKAVDPTLAGYVGLVEPGLLVGGAGS